MTPAKQRFGSRLTAERESREITLEQVSAFTKIPVPLLEALERGDLSRWPKGFYRRALFRTYVTALGLEPEPLASEFARVFSDESSSEPDVNVPVAASPHANASSEQLASISTSAPAVDGVWRAGITALVEVAAVIAVGGIVSLAADMTLLMGTGVIALIYYPAMRAATERIRRSSGGAAAQRPTLLRARPSFTTLTDISEIGSATGHQRVAYGIGSRLASASRSWATLHAHCTRSSRPMARMFGQSRRTLRHSAEATYRVSARTIGWARLSLRHCGKASRRTFGYTRRLLWHGARATGQVSSGIVSRTTSFLRHAAAAWIQTFRYARGLLTNGVGVVGRVSSPIVGWMSLFLRRARTVANRTFWQMCGQTSRGLRAANGAFWRGVSFAAERAQAMAAKRLNGTAGVQPARVASDERFGAALSSDFAMQAVSDAAIWRALLAGADPPRLTFVPAGIWCIAPGLPHPHLHMSAIAAAIGDRLPSHVPSGPRMGVLPPGALAFRASPVLFQTPRPSA